MLARVWSLALGPRVVQDRRGLVRAPLVQNRRTSALFRAPFVQNRRTPARSHLTLSARRRRSARTGRQVDRRACVGPRIRLWGRRRLRRQRPLTRRTRWMGSPRRSLRALRWASIHAILMKVLPVTLRRLYNLLTTEGDRHPLRR